MREANVIRIEGNDQTGYLWTANDQSGHSTSVASAILDVWRSLLVQELDEP